MLKKALLASITAITLNPTNAGQAAPHPAGAPHQAGHPHAGHPGAPHVVGHHEIDCPPGYRKVIKIIEGKESIIYELDGTVLIHSGHGGTTSTTTTTTHHDGGDLPVKPSSKLDITAEMEEQENLRKELELHGITSIFVRRGKSESGKQYSGDKYPNGVYFFETSEDDGTGKMKALKVPGWKLDSTVKIKENLKQRGKTTAGQKAAAEKLSKQKQKPVEAVVKAESPGGIPADSLSTTANPTTVKTRAKAPTSITLPGGGGTRESSKGTVNVAQTGLTGGPAPKVDTSETMAAVAPPSQETAAVPGAIPPAPPPPPPANVPGQKAAEPAVTPAG
jgi:hypothetical protein